ncbi:replicase polyprotein 1a [Striga asiatica]|uniref:Replicase polyprotein 1a n=1 Tax=Striga asiatica TaxID=4170 RepID=A0A5A7QXA3_STRAF|nr:replicase polyprotein 1a [Striga asiatica]
MEKVKVINRTDLVSLSRLLSSAVVVSGGGEVVLEELAAVGALVRRVMIGGCRWLPSSLVAGADKAGGDRRRARWWFRDLAVLGCLLVVLIAVLIVMLVVLCGYVSFSSVDCVDVLLLNSGNLGDHFLPFAGQDISAPVAFIFSSFDNDLQLGRVGF